MIISENPAVSPLELAYNLCHRDDIHGLIFFDSSKASEHDIKAGRARWSVVLYDPEEVLSVSDQNQYFLSGKLLDKKPLSKQDALSWMTSNIKPEPDFLKKRTDCALPFIKGLAGFLSFEYAWHIDQVYENPHQARGPLLWVGHYLHAAVYDHKLEQWYWTKEDRNCDAFKKLETAFNDIEQAKPTHTKQSNHKDIYDNVPRFILADQRYDKDHKTCMKHYCTQVSRCQKAIEAGDLFEINYTERIEAPWPSNPFELYSAMRAHASGAYFGYLSGKPFDDISLASVSPEQFLEIRKRHMRTRPIKGSSPRSENPAEDSILARNLKQSVKDRAENMMIVDLMRNDLAQVCVPGSVRATQLCELESFSGIHHLVSTVEGTLSENLNIMDAFLASFPAGSITGAPKLRSIEYIAKFEGSARGAYTGSLFYASAHGFFDSNVLIRSAEVISDTARYGAGGAVVTDSVPSSEYDEAILKMRPFLNIFNHSGYDR